MSCLASTVRIDRHQVRPETALRVLGILVDHKLTWKAHIQQAATKGKAAFEALSSITASVWGPSVRPPGFSIQQSYALPCSMAPQSGASGRTE
ncbi:hypothetical protein AJ79_09600 [Helicocarpus griseus UAMH5409]|uniref:Uncharacterized protein n=1 Tax=Helicocarpus griseus UAMH5409 TaxID=1447875 RepID=A0A2B7WI44_9EURO|nr:hypothetical protein AJ79_09600 [Helicocarpus griseus UAMH5409]